MTAEQKEQAIAASAKSAAAKPAENPGNAGKDTAVQPTVKASTAIAEVCEPAPKSTPSSASSSYTGAAVPRPFKRARTKTHLTADRLQALLS